MLDAVVPSIVDDIMRSRRDDVGNDEEDDEQLDGLVKAPTTSDDANAITATTAHNTAMTTTPINVPELVLELEFNPLQVPRLFGLK